MLSFTCLWHSLLLPVVAARRCSLVVERAYGMRQEPSVQDVKRAKLPLVSTSSAEWHADLQCYEFRHVLVNGIKGFQSSASCINTSEQIVTAMSIVTGGRHRLGRNGQG